MHRAAGQGTYGAIYAVVRRIPEGRVASYGQVAVLAGLPGHARQVGYALHALPEGSDVPWQRVINARGEVSPRAEPGWEGYQRHLLEEEGVEFDLAGRVDLDRFTWEPGNGHRPQASGPRRSAGRSPVRAQVDAIEALLLPLGRVERAAGEKAYLKSELRFLGVDTPTMRRTVRAWLQERKSFARGDLTALVEALWRRPLHELRHFAIELLVARQTLLEADDLPLLESLLRRSGTWAYVDSLAAQVVGPLVERHRRLLRTLDRWARDPDFWIRRAALLALLLPLRRGEGRWEESWKRFVRYADPMLEEKEFFIRKAIGWVLREVGKKDPGRVRDFLAKYLDRVSGLTLREGIKFLPARERDRLLKGYDGRRAPIAARRSPDRVQTARRPSRSTDEKRRKG